MSTIERTASNLRLQIVASLDTETGHEYYVLLDRVSGQRLVLNGKELEFALPVLGEHKQWIQNMKDVYEL